jgi:hypothetical protein
MVKKIDKKIVKSEAVAAEYKRPALDTAFPADARLCDKCHTRAVINRDNCLTCLQCGDSSRCG